MYRLFHDYKNDRLEIIINNNSFNDKQVFNDVIYYFNNKNVVKIDINNISSYVKIKVNGMVINPIEDIVNLLNSILKNYGDLYHLKYKNESGFLVGHVLEKDNNFYQVDIGKTITIIEEKEVPIDSYIIVGMIGSMLIDKKILDKYKMVTYYDIGIDDNKEIAIISKDKPGKDYFLN